MTKWKERALQAEERLQKLRYNPLKGMNSITFSKKKWELYQSGGTYHLFLKKQSPKNHASNKIGGTDEGSERSGDRTHIKLLEG